MATSESSDRPSLTLRVRMGSHDAHYGGNLVDGARILALFGDAATGLLAMHDGDEGLFVAYESVEFLAPTFAGDFIEARAEIVRIGTRSRGIAFTAHKFIAARPELGTSAAARLNEPVLICRARGTCVVPKPL